MNDKQLTPEEINLYLNAADEEIERLTQQTATLQARVVELEKDRNDRIELILTQMSRIAELERQLKATESACEKWCNRWAEKNQNSINQQSRISELERENKEMVELLKKIYIITPMYTEIKDLINRINK